MNCKQSSSSSSRQAEKSWNKHRKLSSWTNFQAFFPFSILFRADAEHSLKPTWSPLEAVHGSKNIFCQTHVIV